MNERYSNEFEPRKLLPTFYKRLGAIVLPLALAMGPVATSANAQELNFQTVSGSVDIAADPTAEPTVEPTVEPTAEPTAVPTVEPTAEPTTPAPKPIPGPTRPCIEVIGHRGTKVHHTENTYKAFQASINGGADVVEMDTARTKPVHGKGSWIINHDETLNRTTNGTGKVKDRTINYIRSKHTNDHQPIATLEGSVRLVANSDADMEIEIKPKSVGKGSLRYIASVIKRYGMRNRTEISSTSPSVLKKFNSLHSGIDTGYITKKRATPSSVNNYADSIIIKNDAVTKGYVADAHRHGLNVEVWTPDDRTKWNKYDNYNVDGIVTNYPNGADKWRDSGCK